MITTLTGSNAFLLKSELDRRTKDFVKAHGDMGLEQVDGEEAEFNRLLEAIQNLPFLADKKLIVLRNPGANKEFAEKIADVAESIPETNDVVIYEPKLDKRSRYAKFLQKQTDYQAFDELNAQQLPKWLTEQAKERGGTLSLSDATYLVNRVGPNQLMLHNELDKLILYNPAITKDSIDKLTELAPQSTIFQLLEAAFAGNQKRALELYQEQRAQRVEQQAIIPMLAWQLQVLAFIKTAGDRTPDEIAKEAKLNPFVVRKSLPIAAKLTMKKLKELIHNLRKIDVQLKTTSLDADEALKLFLLDLGS
jgi:DNA polymerase-3 subunit delta